MNVSLNTMALCHPYTGYVAVLTSDPLTLNPKPKTVNPKPQPQNPKTEDLNLTVKPDSTRIFFVRALTEAALQGGRSIAWSPNLLECYFREHTSGRGVSKLRVFVVEI